LRGRIKRILGPGVRVYDPSRPVARRVRQLLVERDALARLNGAGPAGRDSPTPAHRFYTTGDTRHFAAVAGKLLRFPVGDVGYVEL
jgi:glutamate racemase